MNDLVPDVGIPNLAAVESNIFRGGQPSDYGWNWLKQSGVTRVIKLNMEGEDSDVAAKALNLELVYKPINLEQQLVFRPRYEDVVAAVDAIQPNSFIHCQHGQDRTGLVVACYRVWKQGWKKEVAEAEMRQHGFHWDLLGLELFWEWAV